LTFIVKVGLSSIRIDKVDSSVSFSLSNIGSTGTEITGLGNSIDYSKTDYYWPTRFFGNNQSQNISQVSGVTNFLTHIEYFVDPIEFS